MFLLLRIFFLATSKTWNMLLTVGKWWTFLAVSWHVPNYSTPCGVPLDTRWFVLQLCLRSRMQYWSFTILEYKTLSRGRTDDVRNSVAWNLELEKSANMSFTDNTGKKATGLCRLNPLALTSLRRRWSFLSNPVTEFPAIVFSLNIFT